MVTLNRGSPVDASHELDIQSKCNGCHVASLPYLRYKPTSKQSYSYQPTFLAHHTFCLSTKNWRYPHKAGGSSLVSPRNLTTLIPEAGVRRSIFRPGSVPIGWISAFDSARAETNLQLQCLECSVSNMKLKCGAADLFQWYQPYVLMSESC